MKHRTIRGLTGHGMHRSVFFERCGPTIVVEIVRLCKEGGKVHSFPCQLSEKHARRLCTEMLQMCDEVRGRPVGFSRKQAVALIGACSVYVGDCPNAPGFPGGVCEDCEKAPICKVLEAMGDA